MFLGLFEPFSKSWKNAKNWAKSKGKPVTIFFDIGHFFNLLKMVLKQRLHALESFSTAPDVFLGFFDLFIKSWKNGKNWAKSKG